MKAAFFEGLPLKLQGIFRGGHELLAAYIFKGSRHAICFAPAEKNRVSFRSTSIKFASQARLYILTGLGEPSRHFIFPTNTGPY